MNCVKLNPVKYSHLRTSEANMKESVYLKALIITINPLEGLVCKRKHTNFGIDQEQLNQVRQKYK